MPLPPLYRQLHNIKHFSNLFCKFIIKRNMNHKIEYNRKEYKEHGFYPHHSCRKSHWKLHGKQNQQKNGKEDYKLLTTKPRRSNIEYVLSENQTASKISSSPARLYSLVIIFRESFEKDVWKWMLFFDIFFHLSVNISLRKMRYMVVYKNQNI